MLNVFREDIVFVDYVFKEKNRGCDEGYGNDIVDCEIFCERPYSHPIEQSEKGECEDVS
jgi:hypothetical protein